MSLHEHDQILFDEAIERTKVLLNKDLQTICRAESLQVTGVKQTLIKRVNDRLKHLLDLGEIQAFRDLCNRILPAQPSPRYGGTSAHDFMARSSGQYNDTVKGKSSSYSTPPSYANTFGNASVNRPSGSSANVKFGNTPFHEILEPLTRNTDLPVIHQNRHNISATFNLGSDKVHRFQTDKSLRVLVYCTSDFDSPNPDIAFPSQIELKANGEAFSGNLRGVKKRPGTTRPADITSFVRKIVGYQNSVSVVYAATDKKFTFVVNLVRKHSVSSLVSRISQGNTIPKQSVVDEMKSKANDADIVLASTVMSLKCPLSAMRIALPCRSTVCSHNQCFDAESFLQLQEQAPQWSCPICNKNFRFEDLAVDMYVQDILKRFPRSIDQVTIEPDGTVKSGDLKEKVATPTPSTSSQQTPVPWYRRDYDDDDIIEIGVGPRDQRQSDYCSLPTPVSGVPKSSSQSRQPSAGVSTPSVGSTKRKQPEVVDLTLSSDDEDGEPPRRPIKRQSTGGLGSSFNSSLPSLGPKPQENNRPQMPTNGATFAMPMPPRPLAPSPTSIPSWGPQPSHGFARWGGYHGSWNPQTQQ